jgi:hypothetical protein
MGYYHSPASVTVSLYDNIYQYTCTGQSYIAQKTTNTIVLILYELDLTDTD